MNWKPNKHLLKRGGENKSEWPDGEKLKNTAAKYLRLQLLSQWTWKEEP